MYDGDHRFAFPSYHFPCHLLPVDKPSKSKHLCLPRIGSFLPNGSIRQVPLICVEYIPLHQSDIDSILSGRLNLTWLRSCCSKMRLTLYIHGQLLSMKTLNIARPTFSIVSSSKLQVLKAFEFQGSIQIVFLLEFHF